MSLLRSLIVAIPLCILGGCGPGGDRQDIDLSDRVVESPVDGIGHYVYALNLPESVTAGSDLDVQMEWRTVGSVDPNARYTMEVRISGPREKTFTIPSGANTVGELHLANWLNYDFPIPDDYPAGSYQFAVRLRDANRESREIPLGFSPELRTDGGFYRIASFEVAAR